MHACARRHRAHVANVKEKLTDVSFAKSNTLSLQYSFGCDFLFNQGKRGYLVARFVRIE